MLNRRPEEARIAFGVFNEGQHSSIEAEPGLRLCEIPVAASLLGPDESGRDRSKVLGYSPPLSS